MQSVSDDGADVRVQSVRVLAAAAEPAALGAGGGSISYFCIYPYSVGLFGRYTP